MRLLAAALLSLFALFFAALPAASANERALYVYYTHTKETARIVFKRNGQYVQSGLRELNVFLRDWRRNEPANMDPRLFDLVWEVYQEVGGSQPIHVVSAYRSPQTNAMLAKTSSGVADDSQHMRGTAMDFFIPGVPLNRLRAVAMKKQVGGVGYYPTSGSPFVHLDTGSVRAWPRMTRTQLAELFPDGKTMHVPTDGKPLSQEGYQIAMAEWKRCHAFPCNGSSASGTQVASSGGSGRTLMDVLFGGNDNGQPAAAATPAPAPQVQTASLAPQQAVRVAPAMPTSRPADLGAAPAMASAAPMAPAEPALPFGTTGSAPLTPEELGRVQVASLALPVAMPDDLRQNRATAQPAGDAVTAIAALSPVMPTPRVIMTEPPAEMLTAYAPAAAPEAGGQNAIEALITGSTNVALRLPGLPTPIAAATGLRSAPLGGTTDPMAGLFDQTFGATGTAQPDMLANALAQHVARSNAGIEMRKPDLIAPDLDHVADIFIAPATMNSSHFAVIFDHDEADFDPTPEMGRHVLVKGTGNQGPGQMRSPFQLANIVN
ncbi:DUF882 domain-containing protein [Devosia faecipullorum]|uniref:DUF882 domain-containing protein n=1 Tax=Devosia faecipullorum TaxID=2755039 RepID=UPI00187BAF04|nr:DUF882 domain-containing protein [Devosia faecipullorum]MBE7733099.1 DUF882 domain-containing protein [Devosia faecipullorum]